MNSEFKKVVFHGFINIIMIMIISNCIIAVIFLLHLNKIYVKYDNNFCYNYFDLN